MQSGQIPADEVIRRFRSIVADGFLFPNTETDIRVFVQRLIEQCLPGHLGVELQHLAADESVAIIEHRRAVSGLHGLMHGGTIFTLGDTLTGLMSVFYAGDAKRSPLTTGASIRYLRPVPNGSVRAVAKCLESSSGKLRLQCDFFNDAKERVARAKYDYSY